jgi:2-formylbenzoate dehydrogenase
MASPADIANRSWHLWIDGQPTESMSGERFATVNPANGRALAHVSDAGPGDVERAVASSKRAQRDWSHTPVRERGAMLRALAAVLREHVEELATLDALDSGNPLTAMRNDVDWGATLLEYFSEAATALDGDAIRASTPNLHYTERVPYGVVGRIIPFNHPLFFAAGKVAAPLMAGNTVVLKPSDITPLSALRLGELSAGILPPGVLSVLPSSAVDTSRSLVAHPDVRRIGFIGSETVGRAIQADAAASGVKDVSLELGGKNALIVCPDADLAAAADGIVRGMNFAWSQGQSCGSTSRVLLHEDIADEVTDRVVRAVAALRVGDPMREATQMGPLASQAQMDKSLHHIDTARREGARLLTGGGRAENLAAGYFVAPTVFDQVTDGMTLAHEEVFGPVMAILRWRDEEEAIRIANATRYGLTASVWTRDLSRAITLSRRLEAGYLWINGSSQHFWGMPFGGVKSSGLGREESVDELLSYTEVKAVNIVV